MLLHLLFPDYPDGHGDDGENAQKMPAAEQSQVANAEPNLHLLFIKPQYIVYKTKKKPLYIAVFSFGGVEGTRTLGLCVANASLYQLSHNPTATYRFRCIIAYIFALGKRFSAVLRTFSHGATNFCHPFSVRGKENVAAGGICVSERAESGILTV